MSLHMFLEVLGTFERLATEFALVRFQRDVNSNVGSDVVAFDGCCVALTPGACEIEVIRRLATNVSFADMLL